MKTTSSDPLGLLACSASKMAALWLLCGLAVVATAAPTEPASAPESRCEVRPEVGAICELTWALSVDGQPAGEQRVVLRQEGTVRMLELTAFVPGTVQRRWPFRARRAAPAFEQRLTATRLPGEEASVHSVRSIAGSRLELQARETGAMWRLAITDDVGTRDRKLPASRVSLSVVDLLDPTTSGRLAGLEQAGLLDPVSGEVRPGAVVDLGVRQLEVGGAPTPLHGWEFRAADDVWRWYLSPNGYLVRFEQPLGDRVVRAELVGGAPRGQDDFGVPSLPDVEVLDEPS